MKNTIPIYDDAFTEGADNKWETEYFQKACVGTLPDKLHLGNHQF